MDFSWLKMFWKGIQAVLMAAAAVALTAGLEVVFGAIDTPDELSVMGVPGWAFTLILLGVGAARNGIKWLIAKYLTKAPA